MNPWQALRGLPRPVWLFAFAMLVNRAGSMVLPFLVLYLTRSLGFSPVHAGLLFSTYGVGAFLASPIGGKLCDRYPARHVVTCSLGLSSLVMLIFPLAHSPVAVGVACLCLALATEAFRPASLVLMSELVPPEGRKPAFALFRLAVNLGLSVGPALGGLLATIWFPAIFLIDGATSLLATLLLLLTFGRLRAPARKDDAPAAVAPAPSRPGYRTPSFLFFLFAALLIAMVSFQMDAALPVYLVEHLGISERAYGLLFPINAGIILALEVPLSSATASWPHRRSLAVGALLCALSTGGFVFVRGLAGAIVAFVIWTFGEMIIFPTLPAYVADVSPPGRAGEYMGLYATAFALAFTVGPGLGVAVLERWGGSVLWPGGLCVGVLAAAMLSRVVVPAKPAAGATSA